MTKKVTRSVTSPEDFISIPSEEGERLIRRMWLASVSSEEKPYLSPVSTFMARFRQQIFIQKDNGSPLKIYFFLEKELLHNKKLFKDIQTLGMLPSNAYCHATINAGHVTQIRAKGILSEMDKEEKDFFTKKIKERMNGVKNEDQPVLLFSFYGPLLKFNINNCIENPKAKFYCFEPTQYEYCKYWLCRVGQIKRDNPGKSIQRLIAEGQYKSKKNGRLVTQEFLIL